MTDIERIKELTKLLNHYRNQYYNKNISEISDQEYDRLFDELKEKEDKTGFCLANSPTQTVGYEVKSELEKSIHKYPMLSADKTKDVGVVKKNLLETEMLFSHGN